MQFHTLREGKNYFVFTLNPNQFLTLMMCHNNNTISIEIMIVTQSEFISKILLSSKFCDIF